MNLSEDINPPGPAPTVLVDEADEWLQQRLEEVASYDKKTANQCADALVGASDLEGAELEVLESLYFLSVAQPKVAERLKLSSADLGRQLALQLEQEGQADRAIAVLQRTAADYPQSRSVERELAGVMRRAGLVSELVDRYLERSEDLLKRGRTMEAIPWLQEVLLVDRSRRDVARLIRDLRYQDVETAARAKRRKRLVLLAAIFSVLLTLVGLRELKTYREYDQLASPEAEDLDSWRGRLDALQQFADDNPIWHRTFLVRGELADLRTEVRRLEELAVEAARERRQEGDERRLQAERSRTLGVALAESGDLEAALEHFEEALRWSDSGWAERAQVQRDVKAIREWLEGAE